MDLSVGMRRIRWTVRPAAVCERVCNVNRSDDAMGIRDLCMRWQCAFGISVLSGIWNSQQVVRTLFDSEYSE
jgi:hypothetical protein